MVKVPAPLCCITLYIHVLLILKAVNRYRGAFYDSRLFIIVSGECVFTFSSMMSSLLKGFLEGKRT